MASRDSVHRQPEQLVAVLKSRSVISSLRHGPVPSRLPNAPASKGCLRDILARANYAFLKRPLCSDRCRSPRCDFHTQGNDSPAEWSLLACSTPREPHPGSSRSQPDGEVCPRATPQDGRDRTRRSTSWPVGRSRENSLASRHRGLHAKSAYLPAGCGWVRLVDASVLESHQAGGDPDRRMGPPRCL